MRNPGFGEPNLGAMAGVVVGAIGGLFAIGIGPAIVGHRLELLFGTPILALICWVVSGLLGWVLGGQVGPRLGEVLNSQKAEAIGGVIAGLVPVVVIAWWGWSMVRGQ
jgi:hypothetical protein